jgi:hypothetical protein
MTRLRSLQEHLNRWMLAYVSLAILVGLLAGNGLAGFAKSQAGRGGPLPGPRDRVGIVSVSTLRAVRSGAAWRR